ncbi:U4/U6-U5 snRNP complex subunit prp31 [Blastocladiella emersonii ATCC 22665]|nr:U4/U6-U5 snRNP complex subunit prp31 [Blastocladiella emersonii ATCC 22665]
MSSNHHPAAPVSSLLADLEDLDDFGSDSEQQELEAGSAAAPAGADADGDVAMDDGAADDGDAPAAAGAKRKRADLSDNDDDEEDEAVAAARRERAIADLISSSRGDLRSLARVYYSKSFRDLQAKVAAFRTRLEAGESPEAWPAAERDDEYATMVAANALLPDLDTDVAVLHKFVVDEWGPRFPELASLVRSPLEYLRTVMALGRGLDASQDELRAVLPEAVVLSVTLALSTNQPLRSGAAGGRASTNVRRGREIGDDAQARAEEACRVAMALDEARTSMLAYIESRMTVLSPNVSALVGTAVAARLVGAAGGLLALTRIAACNILVLGKLARRGDDNATAGAVGLSNIGTGQHRGFVWDADFVRLTPNEYRRKAARLISAKVCLCARMDLNHSCSDGSYGRKLKSDISRQLEKAMAPAPLKSTKALPVPDDAPKKRRGGRRARKLKEQYAVTDLGKAANRVQFGVAEEEVLRFDETEGLGLLGSKNGGAGGGASSSSAGGVSSGRIRAPAVDAKSKAKTSDKLNKKLRAIGGISSTLPGTATALTAPTPLPGTSTWALAGGATSTVSGTATNSGAVSGFATSMSFTPVQGLEFADPLQQQRKAMAANERWFKMGFIKKQSQGDGKS